MMPDTTLRKGTLPAVLEMLQAQADVRWDVNVHTSRLSYVDGRLHVAGGAVRFADFGGPEGLTAVECDAVLDPTEIFDADVAERVTRKGEVVPRAYLRLLRARPDVVVDCAEVAHWEPGKDGPEDERPTMGLLDATVNAWLRTLDRNLLVRGFRTDNPDEVGIARALLSDSFGALDNLDVLLAALDGVRRAGVATSSLSIEGDVSERSMRIKVRAPEITALAPILLANYRSPYAGRSGEIAGRTGDAGGTVVDAGGNVLPIVDAGFVIENSETGGGAFSIMPRIVIRVCNNGMTRKAGALRAVHLGGRLDEGQIQWSETTQRRALDLVVAKSADAVAAFLNADYVARWVDEIENRSTVPVDDAVATIERVAKRHAFTEAESAEILRCFIASGDTTAGGVMQAVTAAAQSLDDPDRAGEFEDVAMDVLVTASTS